MECKIEENKAQCSCSYEPCSRKGKCCECVLYHRSKGEIPGCFFPVEMEKTYNRSTHFFCRAFK